MRQGLVWIVLLVALAALGWLVFGGSEPSGDNAVDPGAEEGGPTPERGGPTLTTETAGKADRPRVPTELRGRCTIQGTVRRGGVLIAAVVELRHVSEVDPAQPFKGGVETLMIARMLDAGVSRTDVIGRDEAGSDGRFVFRGLTPGLYEVRATSASGAMGFTSVAVPAFGARVEATVDVPDGEESLVGRITYADGTAFRGLAVASSTANSGFQMFLGGGNIRPATTDAEGRFRIVGLSPGKYQISAILPGVMRVMGAPFTIPHEGEYALQIQTGAIEVQGKVIRADLEEPIAGATIYGGGGDPSSSFAIHSTRSAADGTFTMTLPVGRGGGMFVKADGFAPQTVDFQGGERDVVVAMLSLARLNGRVTTKEGAEPIPGITVFATGKGGRGMPAAPVTGLTDADGRYVLDGVTPGAVQVHAIGAGWASAGMSGQPFGETVTPYVIELEPGQEGTLDLEVVGAGRVRGRVLDQDGRGVPGAVVQAAGGNISSLAFAMLMGAGATFGSVVTDSDGAYEIDVLVPGTEYRVLARAPEHPEARSDPFQAVGGGVETVDLRLKSPRWLDVVVTQSEGGAPLAGATVVAMSSDRGANPMSMLTGGTASWTSGTDGGVRIGPLPEGVLQMAVSAPGYVAVQNREIGADERGPVEVELQRGLILGGRVIVPEGVPVQSVRITVTRSGGGRRGWFHAAPAVAADGTFRVDTLEETGTYDVRANGRWEERRFSGNAKATAGTLDLELVLVEAERENRQVVEVHVIDHDGKPVPAGQVQIWRFHGASGSSTNRSRLSTGMARFQGVQTDGELWVEVFDLVGSSRGATIEGPVTIDDGRIDVRLPPPGGVRGRVLGPDGQGVAGVRVTAKALHPRGGTSRNGSEHGSAVSDTKGAFEVRGLGRLDYALAFKVPSDYAPVEEQIVRAGRGDIVVKLRAGLRVALVATDYAGRPVPGARFWCRPKVGPGGGGTTFGGLTHTTDSEGRASIAGLDPALTYVLTINPPESRGDLKQIEVDPWAPGDGTFSLVRAYTIEGTVVGKDGKPIANVRVQARKVGSTSWQGWASTNDRGAFVLGNLEAGRYEVRAAARGGAMAVAQPDLLNPQPDLPGPGTPSEPDVVTARAGATGVKLVFDPGEALTVRIEGLPRVRRDARGGNALLRQADGRGPVANGSFQGNDTWLFEGLRAGTTYRLWIGGLPGGRYVLEEAVRAQSAPLTVRAREGGSITGTLRLPAGIAMRRVNVNCVHKDGYASQAEVDPAGRFTVEGLPEGTWTLAARAWSREQGMWSGEATATTGSVVAIEMTKRGGR